MEEKEKLLEEKETIETEVIQTQRNRVKRWGGEVFGQFATPDFWKNLCATIVKEALKSFFITLGGTLIVYGKKDRNQDVVAASGGFVNNSDVNNKAFGGGNTFAPNNNYSNSYPVNNMPNGDTRFPGFGR